MAIANDFHVDYYNKLIVHSTTSIDYDGELQTFSAGQTIGDATPTPTKTAVIVRVTDNGTSGTLDLAYVNGTWANNDEIYVGSTKYADVNGSPTTKTTTYTTRALYSFLQDTFDELGQLDDTVPMSAQTPTEFTLINDWFIDDESVKFLTGGALTIAAASDANDAVRIISFSNSGYTNAVITDIGLPVVGGTSTHSGTLLHYNNTTRKWWVRVDDSTDTFASAETTSVTGGTGTGTSLGSASTGLALYTNIYTLGTIAIDPKPETYIFQNSSKITSWWSRGNTEAHIDVLIKCKESGSNIGDGSVTVFVRHYGDLYDHFPIDITSGGRQAVPLASASDLNNNATGEGYLMYDGENTVPVVGEIITGATSAAYAEVLAVTDWGTSGVLTLGHVKGTFQDNEQLNGSTGGSNLALVNGTIGYEYVTYGSEANGGFAVGNTVTGATSGATGTVRGLQDDGTTGKLVIEPTGAGEYLDYENTENLQVSGTTRGVATVAATRSVVAFDDIKITFVNTQVDFASLTGTISQGDTLTGATSGATAIFIEEIDANTIALGNVDETAGTLQASEQLEKDGSNYYTLAGALNRSNTHTVQRAFTQGSLNPFSVLINCAGRTMAEVFEWLKYVTRESASSTSQINYVTMYPLNNGLIVEHDGEEYIAARYAPDAVFTPVKASPFGTFAGGKFFGARGVWVYNMDNADIQAFQLIDSNGTTQTPPNFQSITVSNLVSGDRVLVARTSSGTTIDKGVFSISGTIAAGSGTITIDSPASIPSDTPDTGFIRVVDVSDTSINREQRYQYTSWSGSTFTLSGTTSREYVTADTAYVPYIDTTATGTSASVTVIYSADRTVVARIRRYNGAGDSILPFETSGTFSSTGYSTVTIRTSDTIVT